MAMELTRCTFLPGSNEKRFAWGMASDADTGRTTPLSEAQATWLRKLHHRYRKQLRGLHRCGEFCRVHELTGSL